MMSCKSHSIDSSCITAAFATSTTSLQHVRVTGHHYDSCSSEFICNHIYTSNNERVCTYSTSHHHGSDITKQRPNRNVKRPRNNQPVIVNNNMGNVIMKSTQPTSQSQKNLENVVIIGSGPAGYTAALYAGRANLRPIVLEGISSGVPGGQLMTTDEVENFPGFPDGITGPQLMSQMRAHAQRWGARLIEDDAISVDLDTTPYEVTTSSSGIFRSHSVIIATGAKARRLHIENEDILWGRGISACAICDGAAPIFAGVPVAVVGGGDSACEEAVYLCKYASHVHLLVRGNQLRASATLADRVFRHPSVTVHFNTTVVAAISQESVVTAGRNNKIKDKNNNGSPLLSLRIRRSNSGEEELAVRGLFYAIGHTPNTDFLRGSSRLRFSQDGYVETTGNIIKVSTSNSNSSTSNVNGNGNGNLNSISISHQKQQPDGSVHVHGMGATSPYTGQDGVFAAGDVADPVWRQAVTAAASGCMAALAAERYLGARGLTIEYHQDEETPSPAPSAREAEESAEEQALNARGSDDDESSYNIENTWHSGQFALRKLYHESQRPIIVKYISPTCGPCKQLKPMLHSVVRAYEGQVHYVEIDITKDADIAEAAGVTGSPTVQVFHEKSLVKELRGVKMKTEYKRIVDGILNGSMN